MIPTTDKEIEAFFMLIDLKELRDKANNPPSTFFDKSFMQMIHTEVYMEKKKEYLDFVKEIKIVQ